MYADVRKLTLAISVYEAIPRKEVRRKSRSKRNKKEENSIPNPIFREVVTVKGFERLVTEMITTDTKKFPDDMSWGDAAKRLQYEAGFDDGVGIQLKIVKPRSLRGKIINPDMLLGTVRDRIQSS